MPQPLAPALRLAIRPERRLTGLVVLGSAGLVLGVSAYLVYYVHPAWLALWLPALALAGLWAWLVRSPQWDWLGCGSDGQWWVATREGLRHEQHQLITLTAGTRVTHSLVILVYRHNQRRGPQVLYLPHWRMDPQDFRRLRVRLRWPPTPPEDKSAWRTWLQHARMRSLAILRLPTPSAEAATMSSVQQFPEVEHLLHPDPEHIYSEDELDAIEAIDPELALRLDRAQTFAQRQSDDQPAEGPIDEQAVRQAIEESRRILMQDGGDIEFVALEDRVVKVRLKGACVGCPRSTLDLRNVVERLVKTRAPGVERVANTF